MVQVSFLPREVLGTCRVQLGYLVVEVSLQVGVCNIQKVVPCWVGQLWARSSAL